MKIPKSVKVERKTYDVIKAARLIGTSRCVYGRVNHWSKEIEILERHPKTGRALPTEVQSETFWHELTHAILYDMDHHLCRNEEFVTRFSSRLNKAVLSAEL